MLDAWHQAMSAWFDISIKSEQSIVKGPVQFFNGAKFDPGFPRVEQAITWNAFPKELLRRYGREKALRIADTLVPLSFYGPQFADPAYDGFVYRPHDEYCEWHVVRDPDTNKIIRATFTSEPPEYWQALFGSPIPANDGSTFTLPGDKDKALALYRQFAGPDVAPEDLVLDRDVPGIGSKGDYNLYNKWNTTHGIAHLCAPPNSLGAEIQLGADATVLRKNSAGQPMVEPDSLVCCAGYGGPDRNSDPTIGSSVNALARLGAYITLANPVGLYMDHIDLAGWAAPDGSDVSELIKVVRGKAGMIERLVVEAPQDAPFAIGDVTIAGIPIQFGGQIAECITVKLTGVAVLTSPPIKNEPVRCSGRCAIDPAFAGALGDPVGVGSPLPAGTVAAFDREGAASGAAKAVAHAAASFFKTRAR
jgi:hypothetical protein